MKDDSRALQYIKRYQNLESERGTWDSLWQDISDYVLPRKSEITEEKTADVDGFTDRIYDTTAAEANMTLAAGQFDYLISGKWFEYNPEGTEKVTADVRRWYQQCTQIALEELNRSNFSLEMHELFLDRGGFGTAGILIEEGKRSSLYFLNLDIGTYAIDEDIEKQVDTVYRKFKLTARQAVEKFSNPTDYLPEKLKKAAEEGGKEADEKFTFLHCIEPRRERDMKRKDGVNKPVASIYVCMTGDKGTIVRESGYDEMPVAVTRYLRWGQNKYGYCPSIMALPVIKQVNMIEKYMDALAELSAFPRVLIPEDMDGDVDLRASGVTLFDPNNPNGLPKEWATQGRYDIGKDRSEEKRMFINSAYHVDLFRALADRDKTMTATEVLELVEEKLINFSPTFARLKVELFDQILTRVFSILYRAGRFPDPPAGVFDATPTGESVLRLPAVSYTSKMAMAMKALENKNFLQFLDMTVGLLGIKPEAADWINGDGAIQKMAANIGVSPDFMNDEETVDTIRQARAEAEQAQAAMAAAREGSEVARNLGQVPQNMQ